MAVKLTDKNRLSIINPKLCLEWDYEFNGDLKPENFMCNSAVRVGWKCLKKGHKWIASIVNRNRGNLCPCCSGQKVCLENCLATRRPDLAKEFDLEINFPLTPFDFTEGSSKSVGWICKNNPEHKWFANISSRKNGTGCPCCNSTSYVRFESCLAIKNPELAKQWHKFLNGTKTPFDVSFNSNQYAFWECDFGHVWNAKILNRNTGNGCPICSGHKIHLDNCLATKNPELSKEWDYEKNYPLTPNDVTANTSKDVWWKCLLKGHSWKASISNRNGGNGCPCCSGYKVCLDNCLATLRPDLAKQWSLRNKITPFDVTCGSAKKAWWFCDEGHEWFGIIGDRCRGAGCPHCNQSKGNKKLKEILNKLKVNFKPEYKTEKCKNKRKLPFDFGILNKEEELLGLIEYQGEQHFKPIKKWGGEKELIEIQKRDKIKYDCCIDNKIPLLVIHYKDFDKIEDLVVAFCNNCLIKTLNI